jgi:hypothetical protein
MRFVLCELEEGEDNSFEGCCEVEVVSDGGVSGCAVGGDSGGEDGVGNTKQKIHHQNKNKSNFKTEANNYD